MNTLPPVVLVSFKVLLVLKGAAVVPLVIAAAATSEPKTWYYNTSAKFGKAKMPFKSVFNREAKVSNAAFVGANTVNVPRGIDNAGINSAFIKAAVNVVKLFAIATSTTVLTGKRTWSVT